MFALCFYTFIAETLGSFPNILYCINSNASAIEFYILQLERGTWLGSLEYGSARVVSCDLWMLVAGVPKPTCLQQIHIFHVPNYSFGVPFTLCAPGDNNFNK